MHFNGFSLNAGIRQWKKKSKKLFFQQPGSAPTSPPLAPAGGARAPENAQDPRDRQDERRAQAAPSALQLRPHRRLPTEKAAGCGYSTGEGKGPGACTALLDKDRGFMINLGRFKYLLS